MNPERTPGLTALMTRLLQIVRRTQAPAAGAQHLALALAEGDDETARILGAALHTDAMPADHFTGDLSALLRGGFDEAARMGDAFVATPHLALALLQPESPLLTFVRAGVDIGALRADLERAARAVAQSRREA